MKVAISLLIVTALPRLADVDGPSTETLIDQLVEVDRAEIARIDESSCSVFGPRRSLVQLSTDVPHSSTAEHSAAMSIIVRRGAKAIPALVRHLDDARPIKLEPVWGRWMDWTDHYDCNARTRRGDSEDMNGYGPNQTYRRHQMTVGDLCYLALGRIVNRGFIPTRYMHTLGLEINSPTSSKKLLTAVRGDYVGMTEREHRQHLINDLKLPDHESHRNGAAMLLMFYYPVASENLVVEQLRIPTFSGFLSNSFVRSVLYPAKSAEQRRELIAEHLKEHGEAARDGLLLQLFNDLELQIAEEPITTKYDARSVLVQCFGCKSEVTPEDKPYSDFWSETELTGFIGYLGFVESPTILREVHRLFSEAREDDERAWACFRVLRGKGYDADLTEYCRWRIGKGGREDQLWQKLWQKLLKSMTENQSHRTDQGTAPNR
jgi:hypothetical protein